MSDQQGSGEQVERFIETGITDMRPWSAGPWVRYSDYEAAHQRLSELEGALKPVAELAERLDRKGHLDPDPRFNGDEDLTFPTDVELSVADLKRARAALPPEQSEAEGDGLPVVRIQSSPGRSAPYLLAGDGARIVDIVDRVRAGDSVESAARDFGIAVEETRLLCDLADSLCQPDTTEEE